MTEENLVYFLNLIELRIGSLERKDIRYTKDLRESNLIILGISNILIRKLKILEIENLDFNQRLKIYEFVFNNSKISEVLSWILMKLDLENISNLVENKEILFKFSHKIENWWHSDLLSKIYAKMLDFKRIILNELISFSKSDNFWQRRLSLTSLLYYSRQRKNFLSFEIISLQIKILLNDENYYVQKGIGWTIREMYNVYPEKTIDFLRIYIKQISSIAFQAAVEKLPEKLREEFKQIRKKENSNPDEFLKKPLFEYY